jgi:hypothetical protein
MKVRTVFTAMTTVVAGALAITSSPAAADPPCLRLYTPPFISGSQVDALAELACAPGNPQDGKPLPVTLQQLRGSTWVTVATGSGEALFPCTSTAAASYRMTSLPTTVRTLNCS